MRRRRSRTKLAAADAPAPRPRDGWPDVMPAAVAARYLDERTVQDFERRVRRGVYPKGRKISGYILTVGLVWFRSDLDRRMAELTGEPALAPADDAADFL